MLEVSCGCVARVVGHSRDGEWKVALDEDGSPPPSRPGGVSFGVRPEFWGAEGVEFGGGGVSGIGGGGGVSGSAGLG